MKVYKLSDSDKQVLAGFTTEQQTLAASQKDLNNRIESAVAALCASAGLTPPLVISDDGNYAVEATVRQSAPGGGPAGQTIGKAVRPGERGIRPTPPTPATPVQPTKPTKPTP
jgi:hypothetical protein